jgi:hypothetical protein
MPIALLSLVVLRDPDIASASTHIADSRRNWTRGCHHRRGAIWLLLLLLMLLGIFIASTNPCVGIRVLSAGALVLTNGDVDLGMRGVWRDLTRRQCRWRDLRFMIRFDV